MDDDSDYHRTLQNPEPSLGDGAGRGGEEGGAGRDVHGTSEVRQT
jgi:hypothetical protein